MSILEQISYPIEKVSTAHSIYAQLYYLKSSQISLISIKCNPGKFCCRLIRTRVHTYPLKPTKTPTLPDVTKLQTKLGQRGPSAHRKAHGVPRKFKYDQVKDMS